MPAISLKNLVSGDNVQQVLVQAAEEAEHRPIARTTLPPKSDLVSHFYSTAVPSIRPVDFALRVKKYAQCSDSVFLCALVLLQRLADKDSRLALTSLNIHRLLITAVMISAKFNDHAWFSSSFYAQVGGIPSIQEMNALELVMLKLLDFRVSVSPSEVASYSMQSMSINSKQKLSRL